MKNYIIIPVLSLLFACGSTNTPAPTNNSPLPNTTKPVADSSSFYYINGRKVYAFLQKQQDSPYIILTAVDYVSNADYRVLNMGIRAIPAAKSKFVIKYLPDSINTKNVYINMQNTKNGATIVYTAMSGNGDILTIDVDAKGRKVFTFDPFVCQNLAGSWTDTMQIYGNLILLEK